MDKDVKNACHRTVYVDSNVWKKARALLMLKGSTVSEFVRDALDKYLKTMGRK